MAPGTLCYRHFFMEPVTLQYLLGKCNFTFKLMIVNWSDLLIQSVYIDVFEAYWRMRTTTYSSSADQKLPKWSPSHNQHSLRSPSLERLTYHIMSEMTKGCYRANKKPQDIEVPFSNVKCCAQYTEINPMFDVSFSNIRDRSNSGVLCFLSIFTEQEYSNLEPAAGGISCITSTAIVVKLDDGHQHVISSSFNQKASPRHAFKKKCRILRNSMESLTEKSSVKSFWCWWIQRSRGCISND